VSASGHLLRRTYELKKLLKARFCSGPISNLEIRVERYGGGAILVSDYDPSWPELFEQERARLQFVLGPLVLTIEHMGSTAVPGLAAKPSAYGNLKKSLAMAFKDDIAGYRSAKHDFILEATAMARAERLSETWWPQLASGPPRLTFRRSILAFCGPRV
jgi:hypothetical protein